MEFKIIDADGQINDHACGEEIAKYIQREIRWRGSFRNSIICISPSRHLWKKDSEGVPIFHRTSGTGH